MDSKETCHTLLANIPSDRSFSLESLGLFCHESEASLLQQDKYTLLSNLNLPQIARQIIYGQILILESIHGATLRQGVKCFYVHLQYRSRKQNMNFCFRFLTTPRYNQYHAVFFNFVLLKKTRPGNEATRGITPIELQSTVAIRALAICCVELSLPQQHPLSAFIHTVKSI